ncbi:transposase (fragment) (plasmid) [Cupriavidus taiwanensis]|uniref:Transposase n=1 Tax=Cupriavidus taiwanensis TaxID=164546 RepID=A0A375IT08_9BURK
MARSGQAFKDRAVARLLPPESAVVEVVSRELGVAVATLERWRADAMSMPARERAWTAAATFEVVLATAAMDEASKNAWCRENGVYPQELEQWRTAATQALAEPEAWPANRASVECCAPMGRPGTEDAPRRRAKAVRPPRTWPPGHANCGAGT